QSERWQELAPLPEPRVGMAAVAYSGEIYVIGGEGPEGVSGKGFRYVPETDEWLPIAEKPTPVTDISAVVIGEKIYVPGGEGVNGQPIDTLEIYDPRQDSWEEGVPLPEALSAYALADFEGKVYLFGGWDGEKARDSVWVYEPAEDGWRAGTQLAQPLYDATAVALTDRIVVLGGREDNRSSSATWSYFPSRDVANGSPWERFVDLPEARYGFGAASIYDSIYLLGGEVKGRGELGLFIADDAWVSLPVIDEIVGWNVDVVTLDSELFVIDPAADLENTKAWIYQAFYYSIYIPFVP
ncbi:MAG: kelch repeat-containing protein, partial [Chloroflexota bacterium]|nr:kelch repeat-containing protein [Chloroflexota bacterium]